MRTSKLGIKSLKQMKIFIFQVTLWVLLPLCLCSLFMGYTRKTGADKCYRRGQMKTFRVKVHPQGQNSKTSMRIETSRLCRYCFQKNSRRHMCARRFIYRFIMEPFLKRVYLDSQPFCYLDLYQNCKLLISREHLFAKCDNIDLILYQNIAYYIDDYEF